MDEAGLSVITGGGPWTRGVASPHHRGRTSSSDHVPDPLQRFIRYLARPSPLQRAQDAWEAYFELERVRDTCFGPHVFREFVV
jgi:hypothetical protein